MIVILHEAGSLPAAKQAASDIAEAFRGHTSVELIDAAGAGAWPSDAAWDDALVVMYDGPSYPPAGDQFIADFLRKRGDSADILPVALSASHPKPPGQAAAYKALSFGNSLHGVEGRLIKRLGGMLGLRLQGRDGKIFISYRATDGTEIAKQVEEFLKQRGYRPWRDEAKDADGDTNILPGEAVQAQIDRKLEEASAVLLLDTPAAPKSPWIKHEVVTADSRLIPILPLCFRDDGNKGPRFRTLRALQRWIDIPFDKKLPVNPLSDDQLEEIAADLERFLCDIFRRKCRVPFIVKERFEEAGYDFVVADPKLFMYRSKKDGARSVTKVLSHCSIFEQIYEPAQDRFLRFLEVENRANFALFIYDGELLSDEELKDFKDEDMIVLHHQELAAMISSNFSMQVAP